EILRIGEERESVIAVIRLARHSITGNRVRANLDASLRPKAADIECDKLRTALIDVVLQAIGGDGGFMQNNLNGVRLAGLAAAQIVRFRFEDHLRLAFL